MLNKYKAVEVLQNHPQVDVNVKDDTDQRTALMWAIEKGYDRPASLLIGNSKVDVNVKGQYGRTALIWAAIKGRLQVVQLLQNHPDLDTSIKDDYHFTALSRGAVVNNNERLVASLLNFSSIDVNTKDGIEERTPLIWAARSGYDKIISEILGKDESSPGWCSHLVFHTFESGRCIEKLHSSISCTSKIHADLQKQQSVTRQPRPLQ